MQIIEPHPSLTKSETLESSRTSPPGDSGVLKGGEPGLLRGGGAGEVGLVGLGRDFYLHLKDNGRFWEVLKQRYKTIRFMLFKKFHFKTFQECLAAFLPGEFHGQRRLAWCSPWSCRVGHN